MTTPMPQAPAQQYAPPMPQAPTQDPFAAAQKFLTGGLTAAKWPQVGFVFEGTVTGARVTQQTDFDTGALLFWQDGSPRMQLVVDVQGPATGKTWRGLANTETAVPNDSGMRALYVKGNLQNALTQGLRDAGNAQFELGGHVRIERIQDDPAKERKAPAHNYRVTWTPAAQNMSPAAQMLAQPVDGPAAPAPQQQYAPQAPAPVYQQPAPAPQQQYAPQPVAAFLPAAPAPAAPSNPFAVAGPQTPLPGDNKPPF